MIATAARANYRDRRGAEYVTEEQKPAWLAERRAGVTATEIRDLAKGGGSARRDIVLEKLNPQNIDLSGNRYVQRGNEREPIIAQWISDNFDIEPSGYIYRGIDDVRDLATPDGVSRTFEDDGIVSEIKTSKNDIADALVTPSNVLRIDQRGGHFWSTGYYDQMQWQMHVIGAERTLFVAEQHDNNWPNPQPVSAEPQWFWVLRDEQRIAELRAVRDRFFADLEAQKISVLSPLAPDDSVDVETRELVTALLKHRDDEAVAAALKSNVWKALQGKLVGGDDLQLETGDAKISVTTPRTPTTVVTVAPEFELEQAAKILRVEKAQAALERAKVALEKSRAKYETTSTEMKDGGQKLVVTKKKEIDQ